ncbi:MAG TPA: helix-turn-helix domain-containing protein [Terriglobales bacterium]|nr:helix-turn-helix domain-containing protein [Terriglobales bacterium]
MSKLLTIREAAERTNNRESTWRSWVLKRRVLVVKIGRSVRIPETEIERLIKEGTIPAREG